LTGGMKSLMDRNVTCWRIGRTYCFHDAVTAAKIGIKCKEAGFTIEYLYNKWNEPCFRVTGRKEDCDG